MSNAAEISIVTPGTFHNFDVASALYEIGRLGRIYTLSDPARAFKYQKKYPIPEDYLQLAFVFLFYRDVRRETGVACPSNAG